MLQKYDYLREDELIVLIIKKGGTANGCKL